jgi:DnaJ-class molecular chaperone
MIKFIYQSTHSSFTQISKFFGSELNKRPNLYTLLEVKPGAKPEEIRYNYFKLMSKYKIEGASETDALKHSRLLN